MKLFFQGKLGKAKVKSLYFCSFNFLAMYLDCCLHKQYWIDHRVNQTRKRDVFLSIFPSVD